MVTATHLEERHSDSWQVDLLANDSERALRALYDQYRQRIYLVAMRYLRLPVLAEEVVQDVFLQLWLKRKEINRNAPVEAWLYTVARNNTLNRLKKMAAENKAFRELKHNLVMVDDSLQLSHRKADCQYILHEALQALSANQLKVFSLSREEQMSHLEIAEQLNISRLTVKTHMSRAMKQLKHAFATR